MRVFRTVQEMKEFSNSVKEDNKTIAFVPTMGYLHEGHLSLVKKGRKKGDILVVSIFVNPKQFGPHEDFKRYPRDEARDLELLKSHSVDAVFIPDNNQMYPEDFSTFIIEEDLSIGMCGASRPGFFRGVATIVVKLFNIINPDLAIFGQKDYQQALIIKRVVRDLNMEVHIEILPIVRDAYGLALSSRNSYLNKKEHSDALVLNEALCLAKILVNSGEKEVKSIKDQLIKLIKDKRSAKIDYIEIRDPDSLEPIKMISKKNRAVLVALAVWIVKTHLIDNIKIDIPHNRRQPARGGAASGGKTENIE